MVGGVPRQFKGTVLVISHDRYFLDSVTRRTIELTDGKAEFYNGNYSFYVAEKQRRAELQLRQYEREQAEARRLQEAADRLYQWGTGNKNLMKKSFAIQSRIDRLVKTGRPKSEKSLHARFGEKSFRADEVLSLGGVSKSYEGRALFSDVELTVRGGERIALIGDNGTGKTTLLGILTGELRPDTGTVRRGPSVKTAYMPQIIKFSHPERSLADTLIHETGCTMQTARNRLGAFKFSGEDVFKAVGDLSGGELSRLRLCVLMSDEINLLILDEPTNHLDIASREWIEQAVEDYGETLIFVSHDRYFVNRFATRIWELEDGRITDFAGTYESYRRSKTAAAAAQSAGKPKQAAEKKEPGRKKPKSAEKQAARLEREIASLEARLAAFETRREEFCADYEKLMEIDAEEAALRAQLDALYDEWAELAE
jgi:ATPase subunit of ABC transporter with duplicated ATPase domains